MHFQVDASANLDVTPTSHSRAGISPGVASAIIPGSADHKCLVVNLVLLNEIDQFLRVIMLIFRKNLEVWNAVEALRNSIL